MRLLWKRALVPALVLAGLVTALPASAAAQAEQPWLDTRKSPDVRARALVAAMTLDEKIQLVHGVAVCSLLLQPGSERSLKGAGFIPGIPRLRIPDINYTDGPAGVTNCGARPNGRSTMLPAPIARASAWSTEVEAQAGALMGAEARRQGFTGMLNGVSEVIREPRWGRSFEALSEDPVLNGTLVAAEVAALQKQKVVGTLKHLALNNQETNRLTHNVVADERTMRELHLLPYEIAVPKSGVASVMCSYNRLNGPYTCENAALLDAFLKKELGFQGQVQSDWGATHSTVASALAGLDEEQFLSLYFSWGLKLAIWAGQVPMARLDDMVVRKLRGLIGVGVYDDPPGKPGSIDVAQGAKVARSIADKAMVLLKNDGRTLPLSRRTGSIALIGSHADVGVLSGGGSSQVTPVGGPAVKPNCNPESPGGATCPLWVPSSPMKAIKAKAPGAAVTYTDGSDMTRAASLAAKADVAIVFAHEWRQEGFDRDSLALPVLGWPEWPARIDQEALIRKVAAANKRTIVVLENGGPVTMPWLGDVRAVLNAWYPGSRGGEAIADVLFGDMNPSGRLPVTFPARIGDSPVGPGPVSTASDVKYTEGLKVGYRWYDSKGIRPLFPFGYGLSYTSFKYSALRLSGDGRRGLSLSFTMKNTGRVKGADVAQVYLGLPAGTGEPPKRLVAYQRVELKPGEARSVTFKIAPERLAIWDTGRHRWAVPSGAYRVMLGASSRDIRATKTIQVR